jgi:hypothetical protein
LNDPGAPPDWGSIFHRARRRIIGRLLLVAVLAAMGTALLLGGGLSAQGSVSLGLIGSESDTKTHTTPKKAAKKPGAQTRAHDGTGHSRSTSDQTSDPDGKLSKPAKPEEPKKHHDPWNPCIGTSAGTQYCDAPEEVDGGNSMSLTDPTVQP